jgi:2-hydroxy-3-keto-5-methylthiopentenyl-1-phosphate phosphatase
MLILCDFDGTVTERDVTDILWDRWIPQAERDRMVQEVMSGRWSMREYIAHGYGYVRDPPPSILNQLRNSVQLRSGWHKFLSAVKSAEAELQIISNGLDFYIREFIPEFVEVSCFNARFNGTYEVRLPEDCALSDGEEFKVGRVRQLIASRGNRPAAYVGDGRADFEPALLCNYIFAVRESRLALLCKANSIAMIEFDSFDTVTEYLCA